MPEQPATKTDDEMIKWFKERTAEPEAAETATETPSETD